MSYRAPGPEEELPIGTVLEAKYRLERVIGRGGMGVVYEATHLLLERPVAIKVLAPAVRERADMVKRMVREAKAVSALGHPNIVTVMDMGWHFDSPFVVMEYLVGVTLEAELKQRGPLPLGTAIEIVAAVLDALEVVHRRGIVHRDIKPLNIMLVRDAGGRRTVKVLDFGISKIVAGDESTTKTAMVLGTPTAMSPEQALGEDVDARADLHAVGALFYALLVGEVPYAAPNANVAVAKLLDGRYTPVTERVPVLPRAVDEVIAKALARRPEERYADAAAMRDAVRGLLAAVPGARGAAVKPAAAARRATPTLEPAAAASATRVATPAPPAREGAVDPRFGPKPIERLALDTVLDRPPAAVATPRPRAPRSYRTPVLLAVLVVVAAAAWFFRERLAGISMRNDLTVAAQEFVRSEPEPEQPALPEGVAMVDSPDEDPRSSRVLLMVTTKPKDAVVFVDDVRMAKNPMQLARSDAFVRVRVEAPGYEPRVMQVQPLRSRQVEITLQRAKR